MINIITVLVGLRLKNIALIESLDLAFDEGLTVLTGETGAGKSILLDALDALFVGSNMNLSSKLLRAGSEHAYVEASFRLNDFLKAWLLEHQLESDDTDLVVSRDWRIKEKRWISRSRINGLLVNKRQIIALRPFLIDLTIQGESQNISSSSHQLSSLDLYGCNSINILSVKAKKAWHNWLRSFTLLKEVQVDQDKLNQEYDESKILLDELESAQIIDAKEDIKLKEEEGRLVNGVHLQQGLLKLFTYLKESPNDNPSIYDLMNVVIQELKTMTLLDSSLEHVLEKSLDAYQSIQDLICYLEDYSNLLQSDPYRLNQIQERIAIIQRLKRKYNLNLSKLIDKKNQLKDFFSENQLNNKLTQLTIEEKKARDLRDLVNKQLSEKRKNIALLLEKELLEKLIPMGLENVAFKIEINPDKPSQTGSDAVEFLFSANPGQPLAPLLQIASGGEMSRFLLALKATISQNQYSPTMLFDEIDSGVSGRVSSAIANVLRDLSKRQQVFCVTHQPLVAAVADHHFSVKKIVNKGKTTSSVSNLCNFNERQKELAELAGGDSREAVNYAASLLDHHAA